jgi:hypothetical protein
VIHGGDVTIHETISSEIEREVMPSNTTLAPGDQINYTGSITGYLQNPGTVQPDQGDGLTRILWGDGYAFSVLSPGDPFFGEVVVVPVNPTDVAQTPR